MKRTAKAHWEGTVKDGNASRYWNSGIFGSDYLLQ